MNAADFEPGARLAAATKGAKKPLAPAPTPASPPRESPPKPKIPTDLDKLLREAGVKLPEKK
jgi:hypothetical protein